VLDQNWVMKLSEIGVAETKGNSQVMLVVVFLIINAINGLAAAAIGLYLWENALSALGAIMAIAALWVAMGFKNLQKEMYNYAVILNIAAIVLYLFAPLEFGILGIALSIITLLLLFGSPVKQQFQ